VKITDFAFFWKLLGKFPLFLPIFFKEIFAKTKINFRENENKFSRKFSWKCENKNFCFNPKYYYYNINLLFHVRLGCIFSREILVGFCQPDRDSSTGSGFANWILICRPIWIRQADPDLWPDLDCIPHKS
jgi:hypothetical protein